MLLQWDLESPEIFRVVRYSRWPETSGRYLGEASQMREEASAGSASAMTVSEACLQSPSYKFGL